MRRMMLVLVLLVVPLVGCLGNRLPPQADPGRGREALKTALDAWTTGTKPEQLKAGSPSILVSDPDWEEGCTLVRYEIDPTEARTGVDLLFTTTLSLKTPKGKAVQKKAAYAVSTSPVLTVLRNDPDS